MWVPIEAGGAQALADRRIGCPLIWSPSETEEATLKADWEELVELIATGQVDQIDARIGDALQIRPKAANAKARTLASESTGAPASTLPRGFYLRSRFTRKILASGLEAGMKPNE